MREFKSGGEKCPGEDECPAFKKTKGTHADRVIEACTGKNPDKPICPMFVTKIQPFESTRELENVERFISEKLAGFAPDENELTAVEYEGVIRWMDLDRQYDQMYQSMLVQSLSVFGGMFGKK